MKRLTDLFATLFGSDSRAGSAIGEAFAHIKVAEEEITAAKRRHPNKAEAIHAAFINLCPTECLTGKHPRAYRHHCRELLERVAAGVDLRPATKAEVLSVALDTSLKAPLKQDYAALADQLFREIFPDESGCLPGEAPRETYAGACDELLAELRRKLRNDERKQ